MAEPVRLPQWGMGMQEGTITRWLKAVGEAVLEGEPLCEVETAKVETVMESPASGVLARIVAAQGTTVPVNDVIAVIAAPGETLEEAS